MSMEKARQKILIDCDCGIDDANALLLALTSKQVDVIGITTVCGNGTSKKAALNVLRTLNVVGKAKEIPVYKGVTKALIGPSYESHYHGLDGLGDVPDPEAPGEELIQEEHGVKALIRIVNTHPGEIDLVCLGPLSNIAVALRLDPEFGSKLHRCYVMGGTIKGEGNVTAAAEFNFYCDPESAKVVLNEMPNITLVACDLCRECPLTWELYDQIRSTNTPISNFLCLIERKWEKMNRNKSKYLRLCDPIAMAIAMDDSLVKSSIFTYCTVEIKGEDTRGALVRYHSEMNPVYETERCNVTIITDVHWEKYLDMLAKVAM